VSAATLLQWHYLLFLLPFGVSVLLLTLSAVGAADGGDGDGESDGDLDADGSDTDADDADVDSGPDGDADDGSDGEADSEEESPSGGKATPHFLAGLIGVGRAPLSIVLNAFALLWGAAGIFANQLLVHTERPEPGQVLPSLGIATGVALLGTRGVAEVAARLLPKAETKVISRKALFGLTGRVLFTVTESGGRIRVYDEHNTMHDEPCRVLAGQPAIQKGQRARIVDVDAEGRLLVEEAHGKPV
jgi:hypothetical protein